MNKEQIKAKVDQLMESIEREIIEIIPQNDDLNED